MTRDEFEDWLVARGGRLAKNVTRNTDLLIVGEEPGNAKWELAKKYGVPTLHHSIFSYLGLGVDRRRSSVSHLDVSVVSSLVVQMAVLCEEVLAHAEREGVNDRLWDAFEWLSLGLEGVLRSAWPENEPPGVGEKRSGRNDNPQPSYDPRANLTRRSRMLG